MNLDEILYGGNDAEDDIDSVLLNIIVLTIPKCRRFHLLRWVHILNWLVDLDEILNGDDDLEGDLDSTLLNLVASTISKWWMLKFLR
jgi:hypothetical protein